MAELLIRRVEPQDCGRLSLLLLETYRYYGAPEPASPGRLATQLRKHLNQSPGYEALIANLDGRDLGYAIYAPVFWTSDCQLSLFLKEIFVIDDARGHGVGRALMAQMAEEARSRGWVRMVWTVDRRNDNALGFYKRLPGAREVNKDVYIIEGASLERVTDEKARA